MRFGKDDLKSLKTLKISHSENIDLKDAQLCIEDLTLVENKLRLFSLPTTLENLRNLQIVYKKAESTRRRKAC